MTRHMAPVDQSANALARGLLKLHAESLTDIEALRIATENRVRALGELGLDDSPFARNAETMAAELRRVEHAAELDLKRVVRLHPLHAWIKSTVGVGEKQGARLLAAIGDPYVRLDGTTRTVSQLWAYCGLHVLHAGQEPDDAQLPAAGVDGSTRPDPSTGDAHSSSIGAGDLASNPDYPRGDAHGAALGVARDPSTRPDHAEPDDHKDRVGADDLASNPDPTDNDAHSRSVGVAAKRRRGQRANWNAEAKSRAYLIAESCMKNTRSPYRAVYDAGRAKYADAVHPVECPQCGPRGKPAPAGSPLSLGHQHARALRLVAKAVLRDLWIESRRLATVSAETSGTPRAGGSPNIVGAPKYDREPSGVTRAGSSSVGSPKVARDPVERPRADGSSEAA